MKVLLFTGYGGYAATPQMKEILEKYDGIYSRIGEIVDYVENNHVVYDVSQYFEVEKELKKKNNKELIIKFEDNKKHDNYQKYAIYNNIKYSNFSTFSIVEVDITRPWTIEEYDGAEYIQYLDENKLIDKELNYYEKC